MSRNPETQPLLSSPSQRSRTTYTGPPGPNSTGSDENEDELRDVDDLPLEKRPITPLPWKQLMVICFIRLAEPISFTVIFPFINEMISRLHISPSPTRVGYYAGFVESVFAGCQCLTVLGWGRMSDRYGRRPIILIGIAGVVLSTLSFGFSKTFWWMVVSRSLNGAINGNVAALKSVVGEITDETNAATAFGFLPLFWAVGGIIGPALGGYLSRPAERYPSLFSGVWLWEEYPYLLPCLLASGVTALGWLGGVLFLEETLESKANSRTLVQAESDLRTIDETGNDIPNTSSSVTTSISASTKLTATANTTAPIPQTTILEVLKNDIVRRTLASYAALALVAVSHDAIWVLWLFTPLGDGGLGFETTRIGTMLSLYGGLSVIVQLVLFPPIQRRLGSVLFFKIFLTGYAVICAAAILINRLAVHRSQPGSISASEDKVVLALVAVIVIFKALANACFSCVSLLVNASVGERTSLGTVNGLAQMSASSVRAVGPALINSVFAYGASHRILNGELAWYALFVMALISCAISLTVKDGNVERRRLTV